MKNDFFFKKIKQANRQVNKQTGKQTSKQASKQNPRPAMLKQLFIYISNEVKYYDYNNNVYLMIAAYVTLYVQLLYIISNILKRTAYNKPKHIELLFKIVYFGIYLYVPHPRQVFVYYIMDLFVFGSHSSTFLIHHIATLVVLWCNSEGFLRAIYIHKLADEALYVYRFARQCSTGDIHKYIVKYAQLLMIVIWFILRCVIIIPTYGYLAHERNSCWYTLLAAGFHVVNIAWSGKLYLKYINENFS